MDGQPFSQYVMQKTAISQLDDIDFDIQQAYLDNASVEQKITLWQRRKQLLLDTYEATMETNSKPLGVVVIWRQSYWFIWAYTIAYNTEVQNENTWDFYYKTASHPIVKTVFTDTIVAVFDGLYATAQYRFDHGHDDGVTTIAWWNGQPRGTNHARC